MRFLPALLCLCTLLQAQDDETLPGHSHAGDSFNEGPRQSAVLLGGTGEVRFAITTDWAGGQAFFDQGLGQLHGFWYYEAERSFRELAAHDPECAIAYWGMALANWENDKRAKGFIAKAVALREHASPREKLYIDAQSNYLDDDPKDKKQRSQQLINDYENICHEYPDDIEVRALLACRLWHFSRTGLPFTSREAVDTLIQQVLAACPMHPARHYQIHLWDKHKSSRAIGSAALLGHTAPSIAHMWHMPGHTWSDLKRYDDSAWHQQASARVDHRWMLKTRVLPDQIHNYAHNNEWLVRNWINIGRARDALAMAQSLIANPRHPKLNASDNKTKSAGFGRTRLLEVLTKFELWDEALSLANSPYLLEDELPLEHQRDRLQLIGTAQFERGDAEALRSVLTEFDALLTAAEKVHQTASTEARGKAEAEKKPKKDIEKAASDAGKKPGEVINSIKTARASLQACLAILDGDLDTAREKFGDIKRDPWVLARLRLRIGDHKEALDLSAEAVKKAPGEVLPLAARVEILHALHRPVEVAGAFRELLAISSSIEASAPPFRRLDPIAAELDLPSPWQTPLVIRDDVGQRPDLDSLGPLAWSPTSAPVFTLPKGDGTPLDLESFRGRPVVLILYLGHGCLHCVEQLHLFAAHTPQFEAAGFSVLAVSTDTIADLAKSQAAYRKDTGIFPFPLVADPDCTVFRQYNAYDDFEKKPLHGIFVLDPAGRVLWQDIGADPFEDAAFVEKEALRLLKLHQ